MEKYYFIELFITIWFEKVGAAGFAKFPDARNSPVNFRGELTRPQASCIMATFREVLKNETDRDWFEGQEQYFRGERGLIDNCAKFQTLGALAEYYWGFLSF
jgi:hypothetical protein